MCEDTESNRVQEVKKASRNFWGMDGRKGCKKDERRWTVLKVMDGQSCGSNTKIFILHILLDLESGFLAQ